MPVKPSFMLHTGDISHLSKVSSSTTPIHHPQNASDVHYVPGEHDFLDEDRKKLSGSLWPRQQRRRLVQHHAGVHFIGLVNVVDLKAAARQSARPARLACGRRKDRSASTPIVVFAHIPSDVHPNGAGAPGTATSADCSAPAQ
jgi:hypothetical protein